MSIADEYADGDASSPDHYREDSRHERPIFPGRHECPAIISNRLEYISTTRLLPHYIIFRCKYITLLRPQVFACARACGAVWCVRAKCVCVRARNHIPPSPISSMNFFSRFFHCFIFTPCPHALVILFPHHHILLPHVVTRWETPRAGHFQPRQVVKVGVETRERREFTARPRRLFILQLRLEEVWVCEQITVGVHRRLFA